LIPSTARKEEGRGRNSCLVCFSSPVLILLLFLVGLGFEFRASHFQSRHCTSWVTPPHLVLSSITRAMVSTTRTPYKMGQLLDYVSKAGIINCSKMGHTTTGLVTYRKY
jgi:hypothetical protein